MTKAQYLRNGIEIMNMIVKEKGCEIIICKNGKEKVLFIPGITK